MRVSPILRRGKTTEGKLQSSIVFISHWFSIHSYKFRLSVRSLPPKVLILPSVLYFLYTFQILEEFPDSGTETDDESLEEEEETSRGEEAK